MDTIQQAPRPLAVAALAARVYVGRHRAAYTKQAEMWDIIGRNATPYVGRHASEATT